MGQYWIPVNLTKKEFVSPHMLGSGLKLWEQLANPPGVGAALIVLTAAMPERRGGGDLDLDTNWHGPERVNMADAGPMPDGYPEVARRTIGRWAGDRIAIVGDYAHDDDLLPEDEASKIYDLCWSKAWAREGEQPPEGAFTDISEDVCTVIEHELQGAFVDDGWRRWVPDKT